MTMKMKPKTLLLMLAVSAVVSAQAGGKVSVFLNQVGYYPDEEKVVVMEGISTKEKLQVMDASGNVLLTTKPVRSAVSPWSKKRRMLVDVSQIKQPGQYVLKGKGVDVAFNVAPGVLHDVAVASLKLFYLIRSGVPVDEVYAGKFARPVGHADTRVKIHPSAATPMRPAESIISSPLGWYDAGDYNKYVVNSAFSIGLMLSAYEQNKTYFDQLDTNIPESKNSTSDLLDEIMFNMKWLLTMQDPNDGGVYHKLTTPNFEGFVMPQDCHQPRYVVAKSVTATLDFAAVMAQMARLLKNNRDYSDFAAQAADAARNAYEWAKANKTAFYRQDLLSRDFQPAVSTGTYGDMSANDEFFWAATELYRLTSSDDYLKDVRAYQPQQFSVPTWGNVFGLGAFSWLAASDCDVRKAMLDQLKDYCDGVVALVPTSCFQSPFGNKATDFGWGCLAEGCCCSALALLYADRYVDKGQYRRYALQDVDYLLGRNATGYCYVTGFGTKSPMHPHHRISEADGIVEPFPGMLVGGPNPGQQDKGSGLVYPSNYPDESYIDDMGSYASNEIAINWNASLVSLLCWIDAEKQ